MTRYCDADRERYAAEPPKPVHRAPFARDRARVLHSSALRRLSGKTQVVGPGVDDFSRNRLTHSLEVAQVGRDLGAALGCDPDIVDTACLAHDLGHPPFGHNGEAALADIASGIGGFEGNAQTLRLLTRLEPKVFDPGTGRSVGLNLTRATLDAAVKYPWLPGQGPTPTSKFGVYAEDLDLFSWIRLGAPGRKRCVEAQIMDLSDDIAYSVHDVEDAIVGRWLDPPVLADPGQLRRVAERAADWYLPDVTVREVGEALGRLREQPWWLTGFDQSRAALATLKSTTSALIGRFIDAVVTATRQVLAAGGEDPDRPLTRYAADVVVPRQTLVEITTLKSVASVFVMTAQPRAAEYHRQRHLLSGLVQALSDGLSNGAPMLEPLYAQDYDSAAGEAGRLRAVIDQVASLTDTRAVEWARELGV
ncbi:MAG: deoxyguanosinetriphosphate triphosphohydrolase [Micrococcales bacterium]|nr:MAG: deoxyguanosinetriphosphate triphosphohydrolase [Micrococcales bacterium]